MTDRSVGLAREREVSLVEVLDRALGAGVVITGDLTISLADVDLVYLDLHLLLGSVGTIRDEHGDAADSEARSVRRRERDSH
jgi:hypothetical protein